MASDGVEPNRSAPFRRLRLLVGAVLLVQLTAWLVAHFSVALLSATHFAGFPTDGPFQLFNPLRRIANGQTGAVDFQFFHGLGVPYLHYPIYASFGKTIFSAELSRHFMSGLFFTGSLFAFAFSVTRSWFARLTILTVTTALVSKELFYPSNSLLAFRSAVPVLFAALLMRTMADRWRVIVTGILLGAAFLLGTEQGLALSIAYGAIQGFSAVRSRGVMPLLMFAASAAVAVATVLAFYVAVGGWGTVKGALDYAFGAVMLDQFWYFGAPPNYFVHKWEQFLLDPHFVRLVPLGVILFIAVLIAYQRSVGSAARMGHALAVLLASQLITSTAYLGMAHPVYLYPLERAIILAGLASLVTWVVPLLHMKPDGVRRRAAFVAAAALFTVALTDASSSVVTLRKEAMPLFSSWQARSYEPILSARWQRDLAAGINLISSPPDQRQPFWSTYAGLIEDRYGVFHPSFDYIIHALGPSRRAAYTSTFRSSKPQYVQTIRNSLFEYEEWLRAMHWDFYEELVNNYRVIGTTTHSLWWERGRSTPAQRRTILRSGPLSESEYLRLPLPPLQGEYGVAVLDVRYRTHNPWQWLPVFGRMPRHLVLIEGALNRYAIALAPYRQTARIPVFLTAGQEPVIAFATRSLLPGASVDVESVVVTLVDLDASNDALIRDPSPPFGVGYVVPSHIFSSSLSD